MKHNACIKGLILTVLALLGATVVYAAGGGEGHASSEALTQDYIWRVIDFAIIFAILFYFTRKPIRNGLKGRSEKVATELTEARKLKDEAEAKFAEYDRKLDRANEEIAEMTEAIKDEALKEHDRLLMDATEAAQKIRQEASNAAEQEVARARTQLRQEASTLAIALAEELVAKNLTKEDQARLVDEYLQKVGELQ